MPRRTKEEARAAMLDEGRRIVGEHFRAPDLASAFRFLNPKDVAEGAGYEGSAMLYSLWRDPAGDSEAKVLFLQDLVGHLAKGAPDAPILRNATTQELSRDSVDERWKQVKELANAEFLSALMDEQVSLTHKASSFMVAMSGTPAISEPLRQVGSEAVDVLAALYEGIIDALGLEFRPGIDGSSFALLIRGLVNGMVAAASYGLADSDASYNWREESDWTLFAIGVDAILRGVTQPADSGTSEASPVE